MTTWSRTRASPPASMPGGLNRYATESSASINRFLTCRTLGQAWTDADSGYTDVDLINGATARREGCNKSRAALL
jgi:hypothetical protein